MFSVNEANGLLRCQERNLKLYFYHLGIIQHGDIAINGLCVVIMGGMLWYVYRLEIRKVQYSFQVV